MPHTVIVNFLIRKGYTSRYRGFFNLVDVLSVTTEHPELLHSVLKLYQVVSQTTGASAASIEHNIRYYLESLHVAAGKDHLPRPSNKPVIRRLTLELLEQYSPEHPHEKSTLQQ